MDHPFGAGDIDPRFLIDLDETLGSVDGANRTYGTVLIVKLIREVGPYSKLEKVTLLLAVCGDPLNPDRCLDIWRNGGNNMDRFYAFIE